MRPILSWKTRVVQLRWIEKGEGVSYGHLFKAKKKTRIATLSVGYGDGYPRHLSGRAQVLIRGVRVPVVGVVTMDYTMVDVTDLPEVRVGDTVTLIGRDGKEEITAKQVAQWAETIHYEIVTCISPRVKRIYLRGPDSTANCNN